jgi:hypothetical protein
MPSCHVWTRPQAYACGCVGTMVRFSLSHWRASHSKHARSVRKAPSKPSFSSEGGQQESSMHSALQGAQSRACSCCHAGWSERVGAGVEIGACLSLQDADKKGLGTISENVKVLAEKARANKLSPAEFQVRGVETAKLWQIDTEFSNSIRWCPEIQIAFPQPMHSKSTLMILRLFLVRSGWHLHHLQPRHVRDQAVLCHNQPAPSGNLGCRNQ